MAIIDTDWVRDISYLTPTTAPLWIRTEVIADYQTFNMPVIALLDYQSATRYTDYNSRNANMSDAFFTNDFIDYFAARTADFAKNMADYGARSFMIWNEPNLNPGGGNSLDPRTFASLLWHCYHEINDLNLGLGMVMGGLFWDDTLPHDQSTAAVKLYLTQMYAWLTRNDLGIPWDAMNVHPHNCGDPSGFPAGFTQQEMIDLHDGMLGVFSQSDQRPVWIGEWGPDHNGAQNPSCMSNAYAYLRETFYAMFYFQHPTQSSGCCGPSGCPRDYGTTPWTYVQGVLYKDFSVVAPHCAEWEQLQALLESRNTG